MNEKFCQTVNFEDLTAAWINSKCFDKSFKFLRIKKCVSFDAVTKCLIKVKAKKVKRLFMLVITFIEESEAPTEIEFENFVNIFKDGRPVILQLISMYGRKTFVKNYMENKYSYFSPMETTLYSDPGLKEILDV